MEVAPVEIRTFRIRNHRNVVPFLLRFCEVILWEAEVQQAQALAGCRNSMIHDDLRVKLNAAKDRQASKKKKFSAKSTFVNSFGEATKRYITTGTYERLRKKRNKEIMNYIGG